MDIQSVMKRQVISLPAEGTLQEAVTLVRDHRIGLLPVVDPERKLVGIIRLRDLLKLWLPDFVEMIEDFDFVQDFGELEAGRIDEARRTGPIRDLMGPPLSVKADCGLLRAHAFMDQHELHDLPVVDADGRLVGLASLVDVGIGFLDAWMKSS
jgi:CBS-domain-containing membrane protein